MNETEKLKQRIMEMEAEKADLRRRFGDAILLIGKRCFDIARLEERLEVAEAIIAGYRRRDAEEAKLMEVEGP